MPVHEQRILEAATGSNGKANFVLSRAVGLLRWVTRPAPSQHICVNLHKLKQDYTDQAVQHEGNKQTSKKKFSLVANRSWFT
jgi:hypothetical protein